MPPPLFNHIYSPVHLAPPSYHLPPPLQVANWVVTKSELKMEVIMTLKLVAGPPKQPPQGGAEAGGADGAGGAAVGAPMAATAGSTTAGGAAASTAPASATEDETRLTGLAGGCCFAFNPFQENL